MAEKLEDLNLPHASVLKIIKESLPPKVSVGKDVKAAMSRAASMFILYMTAQATQVAQKSNRKTLLDLDIYEALEETEFEDFIEPIKEALKATKEKKGKKKAEKESNKKDDTEKGDEEGDEAEEDEEEEETNDEDE